MSKIDLDIEVENAEEVAPALLRGLDEGLKESGNWMLERGEEVAKNVVLSADRVWRKKLRRGFSTNENRFSRTYHWQGKIRNDAPSAEINEYGVRPGNSPPIQAIIDWVDDEVVPNAQARAKAKLAHIGNWDPQLQALAVQYTKEKVMAAFAVKGGLEKKGFEGIHFMEAAEIYLEQVSRMIIKQKVEKHMQKELRSAGI